MALASSSQADDAPPRPPPSAAAASAPTPPPTAERSRSRFSFGARARCNHVYAKAKDEHGHVRLGEPESGDWLWSFREPGETLEEFVASASSRKSAARGVLHLQPYADLTRRQRELLHPTREHAAAYFATEIAWLPAARAPALSFALSRGQYDAGLVVRALARTVPEDSLGVLGVLGSDIYEAEASFVFGLGLMGKRAAIASVNRAAVTASQARLRTLKLTTHELGHVLGLEHCIFYRCLMNGSSSFREVDRQPLHVCPVCHEKLRWKLGFDAAARFRRLEALYARLGLTAEAAFAGARLRELEAAGGVATSAP
jgi:archaemetzincin